MKKRRDGFLWALRRICLVCVVALGFMTIVATGGGGGGGGGGGSEDDNGDGGDGTTPGLYDEAIYGVDVYGD